MNRLPGGLFLREAGILVECPRCAACAKVTVNAETWSHATLTCPSCGLSREADRQSWTNQATSEGIDFYFRLPLWLRAPFREHYFYAYNRAHLEDLKFFLEREWHAYRWQEAGHSHRVRVPKWMQTPGNQDALLKLVDKLAQKF